MLPDVNVLVAAHHAGHPHHAVAAQWLQQAPSAQDTLVLPMPVISGFLRLVTNGRIFLTPSTTEQAVDFVDWLLESPHVRLQDIAAEWPRLRKLMLEKNLVANQVPDAWLASLALSLSEPFVTFDKDFKRLLPRSLLRMLSA